MRRVLLGLVVFAGSSGCAPAKVCIPGQTIQFVRFGLSRAD
jgi:hypothetical protein